MGVIYKIEKRRILPRWRSAADETSSLAPAIRADAYQGSSSLTADLSEQQDSWATHRTLSHASDLLTASQIIGKEAGYLDVAKFVTENAKPNSLISRIAQSTLRSERIAEHAHRGPLAFKKVSLGSHEQSIAQLRRLLKVEERNPIAWVELARHFVIIGESKKAERAVLTALAVDKNSRFVVRSASRFFHHTGDPEHAIKILQHSDRFKTDPWIMASEIAFALLLGRQTRMAKKGLELVEERVFGDAHITELASSLGTLELEHGKLKNARRLAAISMRMPNDNSFAQAMWNREAFDIPRLRFETMTIPMAWEAKAQLQYQNEEFRDAISHLECWRLDEPFSVRPIQLLSYVHGAIFQEWSRSIDIIKEARQFHSEDIVLQNNLVYNYLMLGQLEEAEKELPILISRIESVSEARKAVASATWGLFMFRKGEFEYGRDLYRKAIKAITKTGNDYLRAIAVSNYVREELLAMESWEVVEAALKMEDRYSRPRTEYDVRQLVERNDVLRSKRVQQES